MPTPAGVQPVCEVCDEVELAPGETEIKLAEWFDPSAALDLCQAHAISTGALTRAKCWPWNHTLGRFDRA